MKQVLMRRAGGPEVLELVDVPMPIPGPDEVLVEAEAIGVGWPDVLIRSGRYGWMPPLPTSPGSDMAGRIVGVGAGVDRSRIGESVLVTARELPVRGGCYTEAIAVPADAPFPLPPGTDAAKAVCLPNYQVAWNLLNECVTGRQVRSVFVNGAAGAIGGAVVQLARAKGLVVYGSVSSDEKAEFARNQGAHHVVNYRREPLIERILELSGGCGVDLALDHVGGERLLRLIDLLGKWGTLVSYNAIDGLPEENLLAALRRNGARCPSIRIFEMHLYDDDRPNRRRTMQAVIDALARGDIDPVVASRLPLASAAEAHRIVEGGGSPGKVILDPKRSS
ncbi:MAG: zinc-dependent alcohol dehydrogenase family protein [Burkholderiaceae bacterium]|nr:zinc-dependent alcohol dehydrogenase family protein [Burkholderiaceae bacterium]